MLRFRNVHDLLLSNYILTPSNLTDFLISSRSRNLENQLLSCQRKRDTTDSVKFRHVVFLPAI